MVRKILCCAACIALVIFATANLVIIEAECYKLAGSAGSGSNGDGRILI